MGRPSAQRRSARRPGKRERARVKSNRTQVWSHAGGGDTVHVKFGRKHGGARLQRKLERLHAAGSIIVGEPDKRES